MTQTVIYFLRHGEVENPKKILYGRLPGFRLSENGRQRINEVAHELKNKRIEYFYTSPLLRARETGRIVNKFLQLKPKISSLLLETKLLPQGISLEIFKKDLQPRMYDEEYIKQGQESIVSQGDRMFRFVQMMQNKHPGKTILAVSHGDPIMILKAKILRIPFTWEFKRENYLKPGYYLTLNCRGNSYNWR